MYLACRSENLELYNPLERQLNDLARVPGVLHRCLCPDCASSAVHSLDNQSQVFRTCHTGLSFCVALDIDAHGAVRVLGKHLPQYRNRPSSILPTENLSNTVFAALPFIE